ncbi:MAG: FAD binding domain-containing protein [Verrucomicrobiales bacterium]|nr:FAD binding domain-containing protein [Verrucomicrobiales bacterium]
MQSWFTFELDGEECRVEKEDTHGSLASFLSRLDPCFSDFAIHDPWQGGVPVVMGDVEGDRHRFRVIDAGLIMLPMLAGRQIWTSEGIQNAEPDHPVNLALRNRQLECGSERTGTLRVLLFEGYYRPDLRRQGQINDQFDSVVTRTANTPSIREVASQVFASTEQLRHEAAQRAEKSGLESSVWTGKRDIFEDRFTKKLFRLKERPSLNYVDGAKRRFYRPATLVEMLRLKREYPNSRIVSGGTELTSIAGDVEWPNLISVETIKELNTFITTEEEWEIGASISLTEISELIGRECPAFPKVLRRLASRPIRNRATLGGYLASGWKDGPLTPLLLALNSRILLTSEDGERDAPLSRFFDDSGTTILAPNEIIRALIIPRATDSVLARRGVTNTITDVYTVGPRRNLSRPWGTGAFSLELRDRTIAKARIAYSGIGKAPVRIREVEEFLVGKAWNESTGLDALPILNETVKVDETLEESDYRKQLVVTLFQKFLSQHPRHDSTRPRQLTATGEFARLDQPFFDALPS